MVINPRIMRRAAELAMSNPGQSLALGLAAATAEAASAAPDRSPVSLPQKSVNHS